VFLFEKPFLRKHMRRLQTILVKWLNLLILVP
jgi:hypothetical protein